MNNYYRHGLLTVCGILALAGGSPEPAHAQLNDCKLIDEAGLIKAPGGCIARPYDLQLGPGQGNDSTPWSSTYLVKRDPARAIRRGRQLFQRKFSLFEGLGPRVSANSSGDIFKTRRLGAGLSDRCAACHGRPRGAAGVGGDVATCPDSRDAPHLFGLGLIEMLADEMTSDLRAIRTQALNEAKTGVVAPAADSERRPPPGKPMPVSRPLTSKGVSFGRITAHPDGTVDTSAVQGVDADLRVRPFLHQGATASLREFIVGALHAEMGLEAWDPVLCAATDPAAPKPGTSVAGFKYDPATSSGLPSATAARMPMATARPAR